jgi:hypothetical protein
LRTYNTSIKLVFIGASDPPPGGIARRLFDLIEVRRSCSANADASFWIERGDSFRLEGFLPLSCRTDSGINGS